MIKSREKSLLVSRDKNVRKQIDINNLFVYFRDTINNIQYAFDYTGLRNWLKDFINQTVNNKNVTLSCNANSKVKIPAGSWVKGIRIEGSATGITITFNGYTIDGIDTATSGYEVIPRKQYVETDSDFTVSATSWGSLEIIIFI